MRPARRSTLPVLLAILAAGTLVPASQPVEFWQAKSFSECDQRLHDRPNAFSCYRILARRERSWTGGIRHLEGRLALTPRDGLARLALGSLMADIHDARAEETLRQAARDLAASKNVEGEGMAHLDLSIDLGRQSRLEEAEAELGLAGKEAELSGSEYLRDLVEFSRGAIAFRHHDIAAARTHYKKVEASVFPGGDVRLQALVLRDLGTVSEATGQYKEAFEYHRRAAALHHASGDDYEEASSLLWLYWDAMKLDTEAGVTSPESDTYFRNALEAAHRTGNLLASTTLLFWVAQDKETPRERTFSLLEEALADARRMKDQIQIGYILRFKAHEIGTDYPSRRPEAEAILEEAMQMARRAGDTEQLARGMLQLATIYMDAGERGKAISEWLATLDTLERLRDQQSDERTRAGLQSTWAFIYYRVAAYFLKPPAESTLEEMNLALSVIERMRARVLLDSLDAAGAPTGGTGGALATERAGVLERIARAQRGLLNPTLSDDERGRRLSDLDRLEAREISLRQELSRADPSFASLRAPDIPSLGQIQRALAPDEALLSFQSDVDVRVPGWALVITRDDARAVALPDRKSLSDEISLFLGLMERRDGSEAAGAARLHKDLLGEALRDLPESIARLVIIPDGPLHKIPFDALRRDATGEPLAARFEVSLAPSCSTWLRWKRAQRAEASSPVLALADPLLPIGAGVSATYRAATLATGLNLGPLPRAREEARSLVRHLGGGSRVVVGAEATERLLKTADLPRFRILHLAAHAVVDDRHPERSAVLLAPGADDEDGLLQIREIVNLDLKGKLVILSSCSSASGTVVEGEGVMGLARAFFQAGAVAVVGSLWSLRDQEAAQIVDAMAIRLGDGASISSALASARRDGLRAGAPAAAWAGLVVLGNGDFVPLPGGRVPRWPVSLFVTITVALATLGGALLVRRGRMGRPSLTH